MPDLLEPHTATLPVAAPYRLDLTADALRRLAANVVDTVDESGTYRRVLADEKGANLVEVSQPDKRSLAVRLHGAHAKRWVPVLARMLGTQVALDEWYARTKPFPWLAYLTRELRGLRPPRYPSLWEAMAHSIVFQQISIHAAASIMRRTVELLGSPVKVDGSALYAFPLPEALLGASDERFRGAGLSANKVAHLRSAAQAVLDGFVTEKQIEKLPTEEAAKMLAQVRGIGPWSAAVILLRGLGRLDTFPMKDSGVARSIKVLSGNHDTNVAQLLEALGPVRGMLYFHLLLGRIRNLAPS